MSQQAIDQKVSMLAEEELAEKLFEGFAID